MDAWIQRIFAVGIVIIAVALIFYASVGQDGKIWDIIAGIITGIMVALGISNTIAKKEILETVKS